MRIVPLGFLLAMAMLSACTGSREKAADRDSVFGDRYEGLASDGRETVLLATPDSATAYLVTDAVLDSVSVRPMRRAVAPGESVPVEVLVKGALPDACSELNAAMQRRAGHLIDVELTMRRPRGAVCAQVVRPFRFYLPLSGRYEAGSYTLKVNGAVYPFRLRAADPD